MPKNKPAKPSGFQPIEVTVGPQNPPAVREVDFSTPQPQPAAQIKED